MSSAARLGVVLLLLLLPRSFVAQSTSGAAIDGTLGVTATITLTDQATGRRLTIATQPDGRFAIENLSAGGPYIIDVRAPGYAPARVAGIALALDQRYHVQLTLTQAPIELSAVTVRANSDAILHAGRTGPEHVVTDSAARRLPLLNRDFVALLQTTPAIVGTSVADANNRYNNILIDGGADNDFLGLSRGTGAPGGQVGVRSLPLDAVKEFDVLIAPYDVRQGSFQGGQINAVTRSGSNTLHGSVFGFYQSEALVGVDTAGKDISNFDTYQAGVTIAGPVIRDRLHFFVAGELNHRAAPFTGPTIGSATNAGISSDSAD